MNWGRRALDACGRDGDGVGVVLGRDRVAREVVEEGGLCGDGDVDCVQKKTVGAGLRRERRVGEMDEETLGKGRTCTPLAAS